MRLIPRYIGLNPKGAIASSPRLKEKEFFEIVCELVGVFYRRGAERVKEVMDKKVVGGFGLASVIAAIIGIIAYRSITEQIAMAEWVTHTHEVLETLQNVSSAIKDAETGQRGYILTGDARHLKPHYTALDSLKQDVEDVKNLTKDNPKQQQKIEALDRLITQRMAVLERTINLRQTKGFESALQLIRTDRGRQLMDDIRLIIQQMNDEENKLLKQRKKRSPQKTHQSILIFSICCSFNFGLLLLVYYLIKRDLTERKRSEIALQEANEKLASWVSQLEDRNNEICSLGELSDILQACQTPEEAYKAIEIKVQPLFPEISGGIFVISESRNLVEMVVSWGLIFDSQKLFIPNQCWALRRGRSHLVKDIQSSLVCAHIHKIGQEEESETENIKQKIEEKTPTFKDTFLPSSYKSLESLCVPMMAQGEALGVLYLNSPQKGQFTEAKQLLAMTVAEHIGLALANLKLREKLQNQSIRDPLTGLFNRRYLEESLEREIQRCLRGHQSLGIIMIDVDHFKRFNDTFGHEAGDTVLRELGLFLKRYIRGSDIACRYGGEELTIVLPEASLEVTQQKAEQVKEGVKHLNLQHRHQPLGIITLSMGVACYPEHGETGEAVIQSADAALYRAKAQGRDRVVTAF